MAPDSCVWKRKIFCARQQEGISLRPTSEEEEEEEEDEDIGSCDMHTAISRLEHVNSK
jgi:hypothetical protein